MSQCRAGWAELCEVVGCAQGEASTAVGVAQGHAGRGLWAVGGAQDESVQGRAYAAVGGAQEESVQGEGGGGYRWCE